MLIYLEILKRDPDKAKRFHESMLRFIIYGDDSSHGVQEEFYTDVIGEVTDEYPLGNFQRKCEMYFGLKFKPSQTFLFRRQGHYSPFLTVIKPHYNSSGKLIRHEVLQQGPVFLKRSFVNMKINGKWSVMPWRHENDYFHRLAVSSKDVEYKPDKWRSKFLGLLIDTMGTNALSYSLCKGMYYGLTNLPYSFRLRSQGGIYYPPTENGKIPDDIFKKTPDVKDLEKLIDQGEERMKKSMEKTGIDGKSIIKSLDQVWLLNEFAWDEDWRVAWAVHFKLEMYDGYGNVNPVTWNNETNTPYEYLQSCEVEFDDPSFG